MRQLIHTGRLRQWNASSSRGLYCSTQGIDDVPPYPGEDNVLRKMRPLAADHRLPLPALGHGKAISYPQ
jgi:hypothetical protein